MRDAKKKQIKKKPFKKKTCFIKSRATKGRRRREEFYQILLQDQIVFWIKGIGYVVALSYIFYDSIKMLILLWIPFVFYVREQKVRKREELKWSLCIQFKDSLNGIAAALSAGYSLENSIGATRKDLCTVYDESELIVQQLLVIENKVSMNVPVELAFAEFARQSELEDIINFSEILFTAKRMGGDLVQITKQSSSMITQRIIIEREIQTLLSAKKLESSIMNIIPLGIILYLRVCSPGFMDPLYHNLLGQIVMTILFIVYAAAKKVSERIVQIRV